MDFDRYLLQLQGCMISYQNTVLGLCDSKSDAEKSDILVDKIKKIIEKWPDSYDSRKVCLYLICNSDLESLIYLSENDVVGHIVGTAPCLSKYVMFHSILNLGFVSHLQDLVAFSPHHLSADLVETFITISDSKMENQILSACSYLSKACYHKLVLSKFEDFRIQYKFFKYFKQLVNIILGLRPKDNSSPSELYSLTGTLALSFLEICNFCIKENLKGKEDCWEYYLLDCNADFGDWLVPSHEVCSFEHLLWQCRDLILSTCVKNLSAVTLDVWLSWVEVDVTSSVTLQQCVGETAFECNENLKNLQNRGEKFDSLADLLTILSQMSIKPRSEEDELGESSLDVIIKNLSDENKSKKIWFDGLLHHAEVLESADSLMAIANYSMLIGEEDAVVLLSRIVPKIKKELENGHSANHLLCLISSIMRHFSPESHVRILTEHLNDNQFNEVLHFDSFPLTLLSVFNKMVDSEDDQNQLICEALRLCLFNTKAVVEEALRIALEGQHQSKMMLKFLITLKPIAQNLIKEWLMRLNSSSFTQDSQMDILPIFVSELVGAGVLNPVSIVKHCVMPAIYDSFNDNHLNSVVMWIHLLELLLKFEEACISQLSWAPLVSFIGQVLKRCLQTISTFNIQHLEVRDASLSLLQTIRRVKLDGIEQYWLSIEISNLSPIIYCYLKTFIVDLSVQDDSDNLEQGQYSALKYFFPPKVQHVETAAYILLEILPSLTMNEWKYMADYLKELRFVKDDQSWAVFQVYRHCMLCIAIISSSEFASLDVHHLSCLNYCVRSFGLVMQEKILPSLDVSYHLTVLTETLQIFSKFPSSVWDGGVIFLSSLLLDLIQNIPQNPFAFKQLQAVISVCPVNETRDLLESKLFEVFKD